MNSLHERLKEERVRLGLTQEEFAEIGGIKRRAQVHYESGERCPDGHYYAAIAADGADVQYILTGVRALNVRAELVEAPSPSTSSGRTDIELTERKKALLDNYENSDEKSKRLIESLASQAAQPEQKQAQGGE